MRSVTLLSLLLIAGCGAEAEAPSAEFAFPEASAGNPAPARAIDAEVVYVDVRTPEEFASGHVAGAINIPHDQMEQRWEELAAFKDREMVVYCRTGRRSGMALEVLERQGFENVENGGGLEQLVAAGLPVE